jgi:hypothetical protein
MKKFAFALKAIWYFCLSCELLICKKQINGWPNAKTWSKKKICNEENSWKLTQKTFTIESKLLFLVM